MLHIIAGTTIAISQQIALWVKSIAFANPEDPPISLREFEVLEGTMGILGWNSGSLQIFLNMFPDFHFALTRKAQTLLCTSGICPSSLKGIPFRIK